MIYRRWHTPELQQNLVRQMSAQLGISLLVSQVLTNRGCSTVLDAEEFLNQQTELSDPMLLQDMQPFVNRVQQAVDEGQRIVVYGDYDVDGVAATALMLSYLESIGATVFYKLPSREGDGYGLSKDAINLLASKNIDLIITVDNGISALEEAEYAKSKGIDIVITDHHLPPDQLPEAVAVVDPLRKDDRSPAKNLSGVGVAFKAICAMEGADPLEMLAYYGDLVAIGTVADMMSLTGENRTIVRQGVACLQTTQRPGLQALLTGCKLDDKPLTSENISFLLAPRLNAAGRMGNAATALQLLLTEDEQEAEILVEKLNACNQLRQETEQGIAAQLIDRIDKDPVLSAQPVLVVWGNDFHQGVIGIVASRLMERYSKPTIVCTVDKDGQVRGSGRSFAGFSLYNAIASCSDLLERFGGHDLAAGLSMCKENLQEFSHRINRYAQNANIDEPPLVLDACINLNELHLQDVEQLSLLAPYGGGNPQPVFYLQGAKIDAVYSISDGKHIRIRFSQGGSSICAVMFGMTQNEFAYRVGDTVDVALTLSVYQNGGNEPTVSGRLLSLRPTTLGENYLADWSAYRRFCAGIELSAIEKAKLLPDRQDIVRVYQAVSGGGYKAGDLRPLLAACGGEQPNAAGRLFCALAVLQELAHVGVLPDGCTLFKTGGARRELKESTLLRRLQP